MVSRAQIVSLSGRVDVERYGAQEDGSDFSNVVLTLAESDVGEVTLGFCMLVFDVASALVLLSASGSRLISIARSDEGSCDLDAMKAAVRDELSVDCCARRRGFGGSRRCLAGRGIGWRGSADGPGAVRGGVGGSGGCRSTH
jgi:hypothetical protein